MKVVLGVGGGIAAYKAAELARALMQRGCEVQVVMTRRRAGVRPPLTFAALTGPQSHHRSFPRLLRRYPFERGRAHRVAQENEMLVIAPATADLLAKFAHGLADDFLTTLYLAFTGTRGARAGHEYQHVERTRPRREYGSCCASAAT